MSEPGARGLRLRCHLRIGDEAAEPAAHPHTTPLSVISSCASCDVLPSIHLYKHLAGRRQGPLRASFICYSSSTPEAADHITLTSIRRMPGENEDVGRLSGKGTVTGNM